METTILSSILGTMLELSVFFISFYILLEMSRKEIGGLFGIYVTMVALVVVLNRVLPGYAAFIYIFSTLFSVKLYSRQNFFKVLFVFILTMVGVMFSEIVLIPASLLLPFSEIGKMILILGVINIVNLSVVFRFQMSLKALVEKFETKYVNFMALNIFI